MFPLVRPLSEPKRGKDAKREIRWKQHVCLAWLWRRLKFLAPQVLWYLCFEIFNFFLGLFFLNLEVDLQHVVNLYQRMLWMDCSRLCGTKAPQCKIARHGLTLQSQWLSALHSITQLQSLKVTTVLWCSYVLTLAQATILDAGSSL